MYNDPVLIRNTIFFQDGAYCFCYNIADKKIAKFKEKSLSTISHLIQQGFFGELKEDILNPIKSKEPQNMMLLLGRGCPLRCRYCYADAGIIDDLMSIEIADKAVSCYLSSNPKKPRITLFGGGEPTVNRKVIEYLIDKYKGRTRWTLTTCGVLSQRFLSWLADNDVNTTFSIDGPPEIQDFLRPLKSGKPSSPFVEESIKNWASKGKKISVRSTLTGGSAERIEEILDYFLSLDVDTVHLEPLYNLGRGKESIQNGLFTQLSPDKWVKVALQALDWAKTNKKKIKIGGLSYLFNPRNDCYCGPIGGKTMVVNHLGQITACSEITDRQSPESIFWMGNDLSVDSVKSWKLANRIPSNMSCQDCFVRYICRGGCPHRSFSKNGDIFSVDEDHCYFMKTIVPILIKQMADNQNGKEV